MTTFSMGATRLCVAFWVAFPAAAFAPQERAPRSLSQRYDVRAPSAGAGLTAEAAALVLELAWPRLASLFEREPVLEDGELLRVRVAPNEERWVAALSAEGALPHAGIGGFWYRPASKTLHLFQQESAYATRSLLLKGACEQFFDHLKVKNEDLLEAWYVRGIGEHLAMHRLVGTELELGVRPRFASKDYVTEAGDVLRRMQSASGRLTDADFTAPAFTWCLTRYMIEGPERRLRRKFSKLALGVTGSKLDGPTFAQSLGDPGRLARGMLEWLPSQASPFIVVLGDWQEGSGDSVRASASGRGWAVARPRATPEVLEVFVEPDGGVCAGLALEFEYSPHAVARTVFAVVDADVLRIQRTDPQRAERLIEVERLRIEPADDGRVHLRLVIEGDRRILYVGGREAFAVEDSRHPPCLIVTRGSALLSVPRH